MSLDRDCISTSIDQWFKGYPIVYTWVTALWSSVFNDSTYRTASPVPPIYVKIWSNDSTIVELDLDFLIQSIDATFIASTEQLNGRENKSII